MNLGFDSHSRLCSKLVAAFDFGLIIRLSKIFGKKTNPLKLESWGIRTSNFLYYQIFSVPSINPKFFYEAARPRRHLVPQSMFSSNRKPSQKLFCAWYSRPNKIFQKFIIVKPNRDSRDKEKSPSKASESRKLGMSSFCLFWRIRSTKTSAFDELARRS